MPLELAAHVGAIRLDKQTLNRRNEFLEYARLLIAGGGGYGSTELANQQCTSARVLQELEHRAIVPAASTSDSTWAGPLVQGAGLAVEFLAALRDASAFDRLLVDMRRVPPLTRFAVINAGAVGAAVNEGQVKPAGRFTLATAQVTMRKAAGYVVETAETMKMAVPGALELLERDLQAEVARVTDEIFVGILTSGLTPIASAGSTVTGIRTDLAKLLSAIDTSKQSKLYLLCQPDIAKRLAIVADAGGQAAFPDMTPAGGTISGIPVVTSDAVPAGQLVLTDAAQLAAVNGPLELDATKYADIEMNTAPDSPTSASTVKLSLFEMNAVALRCERYFGVLRLRTTAAAVVSGVTSVNSPS